MKYQMIRQQLKTGDILLFSGKGAISNGIKFFTLSKWSHVGMVYKVDDGDIIFCWESTTLTNVSDAETGKRTKGVQLVVLSERIEACLASSYEINLRQISAPLTFDMLNNLKEFRFEVSGRPYEKDKLELIKSAYDSWLGHNTEDLSSLFCSELIAEAYQKMGLLTEENPSNEYTPKDFSQEKNLKLQYGYNLGNEIVIDGL